MPMALNASPVKIVLVHSRSSSEKHAPEGTEEQAFLADTFDELSMFPSADEVSFFRLSGREVVISSEYEDGNG